MFVNDNLSKVHISTSSDGITFERVGNIVTFKMRKNIYDVAANWTYDNQCVIPNGYRPCNQSIFAVGLHVSDRTITGSFYILLETNGTTHLVSNLTHKDGRTYIATCTYPTTDEILS